MAVEKINYEDTLRQGADKINAILEQSNASSIKVDGYAATLNQGIEDAKQIATDAGKDAVQIATQAGEQANTTANEAKGISQNANTKSDQAVSTANQNKQEFDQLRNDFDDLVAEAGDSNPEIVQARTDTQGIKQTTLSNRLTSDFNSRMSKADGIEMISGQTIVAKMMDFQGKTAGNTATNPHAYYSDFTANTLKKPSATWNEVSQSDYNKLASRDDSGISTGSSATGIIPQQMAILDTVATAKALSPQLFDGLTNEESIKFVKDNFVSFTVGVRVKALSPNNKNVKVGIYMPATDSWSTVIQQDATEFTDFTTQINDSQYIDAKGKVHLIYYVDSSNGVKPSSIEVDYAGVQLELTMNAQAVLEKSGFITKKQKATATQAGILKVASSLNLFDDTVALSTYAGKMLNDKIVKHTQDTNNPHGLTAQMINAVNKTEDETITGKKYFTEGLFYKGKEVAVIEDTGWVNGTWGTGITSYNSDSSDLIRFRKIGNEVYFKGVAKNTKALPTGAQILVKNIPVAFIPSDGLNVYFPVMQGSNKYTWHCTLKAADKTLTLDRYGSTAIIEVPTNQWLPFSGSYPV